jgi:hypothetical protein
MADQSNCGSCGHSCSGGESCVAGECKCPAGFDVCSGVCTNKQSDRNNCGACGTVCNGNEVCNGGNCHNAGGGPADGGGAG